QVELLQIHPRSPCDMDHTGIFRGRCSLHLLPGSLRALSDTREAGVTPDWAAALTGTAEGEIFADSRVLRREILFWPERPGELCIQPDDVPGVSLLVGPFPKTTHRDVSGSTAGAHAHHVAPAALLRDQCEIGAGLRKFFFGADRSVAR